MQHIHKQDLVPSNGNKWVDSGSISIALAHMRCTIFASKQSFWDRNGAYVARRDLLYHALAEVPFPPSFMPTSPVFLVAEITLVLIVNSAWLHGERYRLVKPPYVATYREYRKMLKINDSSQSTSLSKLQCLDGDGFTLSQIWLKIRNASAANQLTFSSNAPL